MTEAISRSTDAGVVGFQARLFGPYPPVVDEVRFAASKGFGAMQIRGDLTGSTTRLGDLHDLRQTLGAAQVRPTLELLIGLEPDGGLPDGRTPVDVLRENLPLIESLGVRHVHWHLYPTRFEQQSVPLPAIDLVAACAGAVEIGRSAGFRFGIENNPAAARLLTTPDACRQLLNAVDDLALVWDLNHSDADQIEDYCALAHRIGWLHVSDTRWPAVNEHLPLGEGCIPLARTMSRLVSGGFCGLSILEVGGPPGSAGPHLDTDEHLVASGQTLHQIHEEIRHG